MSQISWIDCSCGENWIDEDTGKALEHVLEGHSLFHNTLVRQDVT